LPELTADNGIDTNCPNCPCDLSLHPNAQEDSASREQTF
jgi:hypothetical protein